MELSQQAELQAQQQQMLAEQQGLQELDARGDDAVRNPNRFVEQVSDLKCRRLQL